MIFSIELVHEPWCIAMSVSVLSD